MKVTRLLSLLAILLVSLSWFRYSGPGKRVGALYLPKHSASFPLKNLTLEKLKQKVAAARLFIQQKGYNNKVCFFIDMSLPSGQNRFFIYDLENDSIISKGLVAHGNCYNYWLEGRKYSNTMGSGCTSLGKYRVGYPYTGKFGYSYKLYGLDSSNSHAFERTVVLHAHTCVPEKEVNDEICQSNGCPMVSTGFLNRLKSIINQSGKPILLWIYD